MQPCLVRVIGSWRVAIRWKRARKTLLQREKYYSKCLPQRALLCRLSSPGWENQFRARAIFHHAQIKTILLFYPWLECASKWLKMKMAGFTWALCPTSYQRPLWKTLLDTDSLHSSRFPHGQEQQPAVSMTKCFSTLWRTHYSNQLRLCSFCHSNDLRHMRAVSHCGRDSSHAINILPLC